MTTPFLFSGVRSRSSLLAASAEPSEIAMADSAMADHVRDRSPVLAPVGAAAGPTAPCAVRGCACRDRRQRVNVPNVVTAVRTVASLALAVTAAAQHSWSLLLAAYLVYWAGDIADGALARHLGQETRLGAVLDVVCDRINCTSCAVALLLFVPAPLPVTVFLVQFVVVDLALSLLPLRWPLLSPNYFHLVDPLVHTLNWHPVAKATNTGLLVLLLVVVPDQRVAGTVAVAVLVVKVFSLRRVRRLPAPPGTPHLPPRAPARG